MNLHWPRINELEESWNLFLQLNIWLALVSIIMVAVTAITLSVPLDAVGAGLYIPFFLVYFIYVRERRAIPTEDRINHPYRTKLIEKYSKHLYVTEILALVAYEILLILHLPDAPIASGGTLLLAQLPIVVLYFYDSVKGNPLLDSGVVAGAWAFLIVFTVLISAPNAIGMKALLAFLAWFIIVFAGVESRNAEDIHGDEAADKGTLAGRIGRLRTKGLEFGLKAGGVVVFFVLGGYEAGLLVVGYLIVLRACRSLTASAVANQVY